MPPTLPPRPTAAAPASQLMTRASSLVGANEFGTGTLASSENLSYLLTHAAERTKTLRMAWYQQAQRSGQAGSPSWIGLWESLEGDMLLSHARRVGVYGMAERIAQGELVLGTWAGPSEQARFTANNMEGAKRLTNGSSTLATLCREENSKADWDNESDSVWKEAHEELIKMLDERSAVAMARMSVMNGGSEALYDMVRNTEPCISDEEASDATL
ncbi:hypothetical protein IAT38_004323 [Cryptococcus sp. DSM 104549]